jgi:hypothetical protein
MLQMLIFVNLLLLLLLLAHEIDSLAGATAAGGNEYATKCILVISMEYRNHVNCASRYHALATTVG